ncbi:olfactory receptor 5AS1-like [Cyprinodon tularosa]|uniref:olfactory receptor 5AS1-like n=1 Tax=Cyprinodon tularosa TaxID=77115 RepID=UPI0018E21CAB|nr:olfactory receptor 5AS1-like [Cyprinodon tularosa]
MTVNSTLSSLSYFILEAYIDLGTLQYFYFAITLTVYTAIVVVNILLIVLICLNRTLREPMYMFLCSLFMNEVYGSLSLFPFLLVQILSDVHAVAAPFCFLQIFCFYSYVNIEFCNLAIMSYDRYFGICCPLKYNSVMTFSRAGLFVVLIWLYSSVRCIINICLSLRLTLCGNVLSSLFCHNYLIVKLACVDTELNNIFGLFSTALSVLVPLLPIIYSYAKILSICFSASSKMRQKAASTCMPHLASLLNFAFGCLFEILQTRFDMTSVPDALRFFLSLYFGILQPLLNPIIFGIRMSKIRNIFKDFLH